MMIVRRTFFLHAHGNWNKEIHYDESNEGH